MAKEVARRFLERLAKPQYRLTVFHGGPVSCDNLPSLLRGFRDGKLKFGGQEPIPDLGIEERFDSTSVWSSDRVAILGLKDWLEGRGVETSGVW
jgi:hypothetical protein